MVEFLGELMAAMIFITIIAILGDVINFWDIVTWV